MNYIETIIQPLITLSLADYLVKSVKVAVLSFYILIFILKGT